jgi:hypothetical protein
VPSISVTGRSSKFCEAARHHRSIRHDAEQPCRGLPGLSSWRGVREVSNADVNALATSSSTPTLAANVEQPLIV